MREIRMLRAMWRELETGSRRLLHGHEGGNPGYSQGAAYGSPRQFPTLPGSRIHPSGSRSGFRRQPGDRPDHPFDPYRARPAPVIGWHRRGFAW